MIVKTIIKIVGKKEEEITEIIFKIFKVIKITEEIGTKMTKIIVSFEMNKAIKEVITVFNLI